MSCHFILCSVRPRGPKTDRPWATIRPARAAAVSRKVLDRTIGDVRPTELPPGRGILVSRSRGQEMIHVAELPAL